MRFVFISRVMATTAFRITSAVNASTAVAVWVARMPSLLSRHAPYASHLCAICARHGGSETPAPGFHRQSPIRPPGPESGSHRNRTDIWYTIEWLTALFFEGPHLWPEQQQIGEHRDQCAQHE